MHSGEQSPQKSVPVADNSKPSRFWTFVGIMNVRLRFIFLMVLVGFVASNWDGIMNRYDRWRAPANVVEAAQSADTEYYCPMHPNIVRATMGSCPICGMPLSKRAKTGQKELPEGVLAQVELGPQKLALGNIGTTPVTPRLLSRELRTVGVVDYDETRRAFIAARIKGRIEKLLVNYVGQQVKKGDPLVSIYSPALLVAQEELLTATRAQKQTKGTNEFGLSAANDLSAASRRKLLLWGISDKQIDEIIARGSPETYLTIYSPIAGIVTDKKVLEGQYVDEGQDLYTIADLSRVWMQAKIFENESGGVKVGTAVGVTNVADPNRIHAGRVTFVAYTVDPATRTVAARVEVDNPDLTLKPGMYANAVIRLPVGQVLAAEASSQPAAKSAVTDGLVKAYLAIASAYAADKTADADVAQFVQQAQALSKEGDEAVRTAAASIARAAEQLKGKELAEQRKAFKSISEETIELLKKSPASQPVYTVHCPMYPGHWLSAKDVVLNPYYGSEMLECGKVTGKIEPGAAKNEGDNFVTGYYCPLYPDRLFDKPEHCALDGFQTQFMKVEKVLAVPESALVDTGTRKVVYRQAGQGVFEMIEVKVGPRAGEYYPLVEGLKAGDKVVTAGAFVVDAENRLNPAAGAQYFGGSGGPQGDHQQ